jgi:16S rRNA (cytosine967-C5)-methyltransferase
VLDACAAPGRQDGAPARTGRCRSAGAGRRPGALPRIHQNLQRLGLQADVRAGRRRPTARLVGRPPFDAILLDAPCTASGIVRRHPDVRWLRRESDIAQLAAQQARLLDALWPLVLKPGGRLVYCTCSVFREEGERRIAAFLAHNNAAVCGPAPAIYCPRNGAKGGVPDNPEVTTTASSTRCWPALDAPARRADA